MTTVMEDLIKMIIEQSLKGAKRNERTSLLCFLPHDRNCTSDIKPLVLTTTPAKQAFFVFFGRDLHGFS